MNILLSGDIRVYTGMELVIYSTLTHNKNINFYIFTCDIEVGDGNIGYCKYKGLGEWEKDKLRKIVKYLDYNSRITFIDPTPYYDQYLRGNPNEDSGFTPYATFRLLADVALPYVNDILYFDCDIAVQGDISTMYYEYLKLGYEYCAYVCKDACDYEGEMVSGIMLMNLKKIRETKMLEHARDNINRNRYIYPDQDAIRDTGVKPYPLPDTYSYMYEIEKCGIKPIILHFTNQLSPKIYMDDGKNYFYRRFPFLDYVKKGVELIDRINF